jgi:hypothetical protein
VIEILRMHPDSGAALTTIHNGRVTRRLEVAPNEAAKLAVGAILIGHAYGRAVGTDA